MDKKLINNKELIFFIISETNWDEMPRMRHHIALQLSRFHKVNYIQIYRTGKMNSKKINDNLTIYSIGGYLRGINKESFLKKIFKKYKFFKINVIIKKYPAPKILINFQFDFLEIYKIKTFKLRYLFINDDFINMNKDDSAKTKIIHLKNLKNSASKSFRTFTSSYPLKEDLKPYSKRINVLLSGHDFEEKHNKKDKKWIY